MLETPMGMALQLEQAMESVQETCLCLAALPDEQRDWGSPQVRAALFQLKAVEFRIQEILSRSERLAGVQYLELDQTE